MIMFYLHTVLLFELGANRRELIIFTLLSQEGQILLLYLCIIHFAQLLIMA